MGCRWEKSSPILLGSNNVLRFCTKIVLFKSWQAIITTDWSVVPTLTRSKSCVKRALSDAGANSGIHASRCAELQREISCILLGSCLLHNCESLSELTTRRNPMDAGMI